MSGSTQVPPQLTRPAWQESWQVPPLQTWPAGQVLPALPAPLTPQPVVAPQKERLVSGSTQVPLQSTRPAWQDSWQLPPLHRCPTGQEEPTLPEPASPQAPVAPQKRRLVSGSMQVPPQLTRPDWQVSVQLPPEQIWPAAQVAPSLLPPPTLVQSPVAPQKVRLTVASTQVPPQFRRPAWQLSPQAPALHTWPAGQLVPSLLPAPRLVQSPVAPQ